MATDGLIEPDSFDLIILGTGLPESILAAAAANAGKRVLHLDHLEFYGAHWTSLPFSQFSAWARSGGSFGGSTEPEESPTAGSLVDQPDRSEDGEARSEGIEGSAAQDQREIGLEAVEVDYDNLLYFDVEVNDHEGVSLGASRFYNIDLAGPRLNFCGSQLINLLIRSGASNYVEFKGVEASYMWTGTALSVVPSSRADVFTDKSLSLPDKRFLMRFFKLVMDHTNAEGAEMSPEILESPFVEFMRHQNLPTSMQSILLYAIALVDTDQDAEDSTDLLKTEDGFRKLALYLSSVSRFSNAPTAFLYPLYGQGELAQAFCRSAAVNGALYVLRRRVKALLLDKESKEYKGVQTFSGQRLYSERLIIGPSVVAKGGQDAGLPMLAKGEDQSGVDSPKTDLLSTSERPYTKVARYVCITDKSIFEGQTTLLVIFPPKSISEKQSTVIRALQLSSAASVCPDGKYIVQFSTICSDGSKGQESLKAAVDILLSTPQKGSLDSLDADEERASNCKPKLLWSVSYTQALHTDAKKLARPGIAAFDMPDAGLDCESILTATGKVFSDFFPDTEFFKRAAPAEEKGTADSEAEGLETEGFAEGE